MSQAAIAPPPQPEFRYERFGLLSLPPMIGGFLYGFDIGATSFVLYMLLWNQNHTNMNDHETTILIDEDIVVNDTHWWTSAENFTTTQQGLFVAGLSLGGLLGSHLIFMYLSQMGLGRRHELRYSAVLYILGSGLNVVSGTVLQENTVLGFYTLLWGRIVYGMGVGLVMHAAPAYLAEVTPSTMRGAVVSAKETIIVAGIVCGYLVGNYIASNNSEQEGKGNHWIYLYGLCGLMALPMYLITYCIPESPRWLLLQGGPKKEAEAYDSLQYLYKGDITHDNNTLVQQTRTARTLLARASSSTITPIKKKEKEPSLLDTKYRKALRASIGLIIFQQLSGQPSVLSYATILFETAGWSGHASVVSSVLMMLTSCVTVALVDKLGRKFLLSTGCVIMLVALTILSTEFWNFNDTEEPSNVTSSTTASPAPQNTVILCALCVYIAGYQVCFGPLTWCIVSEIFPLEIRSQAIALCVELNYAFNFGVQFLFPTLQAHLGWGKTFAMFATFLGGAIFYIQGVVPETTGLTLEEIQTQLNGPSGGRGRSGVEHKDDDRTHKHLTTIKNNTTNTTAYPTEKTHLLDTVVSTTSCLTLLGAHPSLEEMETQLLRTSSGGALHAMMEKS